MNESSDVEEQCAFPAYELAMESKRIVIVTEDRKVDISLYSNAYKKMSDYESQFTI
jgi:hypothetical protein